MYYIGMESLMLVMDVFLGLFVIVEVFDDEIVFKGYG